jgi:hypothetical protein
MGSPNWKELERLDARSVVKRLVWWPDKRLRRVVLLVSIPEPTPLDAKLDQLDAAPARVGERLRGSPDHLHVMLDDFLRDQEDAPEVIGLFLLGLVELPAGESGDRIAEDPAGRVAEEMVGQLFEKGGALASD